MSSSAGPFTRSRTNLFLSYRNSSERYLEPTPSSAKGKARAYAQDDDEEEHVGLMTGMEETTVALPPHWVDIADEVQRIVRSVPPKIAALDKLHAKHVLPGFTDRTAQEREIDSLTSDITRDFRTTQKLIRRIADMSTALLSSSKRQGSVQSSESRRVDLIMAANVQTALATKVQDLSGTFRKKQSAYLKQLKGYASRNQSKMLGFASPPVFVLDDEQDSGFQQHSQVASPDLALAHRSNEINVIAQSITDLADLFKDLSGLVIDQGTLLDRVDYNVEQMSVDVKGAVEELKTATSYQRRSGKCQIIFLLLLLVAGALIVVIYKPRRGSDPPPPPFDTSNPVAALDGLGSAGLPAIERDVDEERGDSRGSTRFIGAHRWPVGGILEVSRERIRRRARSWELD